MLVRGYLYYINVELSYHVGTGLYVSCKREVIIPC